jgi:hypothetical protein
MGQGPIAGESRRSRIKRCRAEPPASGGCSTSKKPLLGCDWLHSWHIRTDRSRKVRRSGREIRLIGSWRPRPGGRGTPNQTLVGVEGSRVGRSAWSYEGSGMVDALDPETGGRPDLGRKAFGGLVRRTREPSIGVPKGEQVLRLLGDTAREFKKRAG